MSLDDGWIAYDTAMHEMMHAVGFWHEHERWDRDDYINILWQNIDRGRLLAGRSVSLQVLFRRL